MRQTTKILFICHGNICRSVMAQCVFQKMVNDRGAADRFFIDSAATSREELGNPVYPPAGRKLQQAGVPVLPHRARQITAADYDGYDLLIGMDAANLAGMRRIFSGDPAGKCTLLLDYTDRPGAISDPWYSGDFDAAFEDVRRGCEGLFRTLKPDEY